MDKVKYRLWLLLHGFKFLLLILTGKIPAHFLRRFLYRLFGMRLGNNSSIYMGAEIRHPKNIVIGNGCIIGHRAILDGRHGIRIGNNVNFSTGVWIWTVQHDWRDPDFKDTGGPVVIGDHVWLSCRSVILPGVTIGEGAVVAAGSVVTKDVEPYSVVGGVPAKPIAIRPKQIRYELGKSDFIPFV